MVNYDPNVNRQQAGKVHITDDAPRGGFLKRLFHAKKKDDQIIQPSQQQQSSTHMMDYQNVQRREVPLLRKSADNLHQDRMQQQQPQFFPNNEMFMIPPRASAMQRSNSTSSTPDILSPIGGDPHPAPRRKNRQTMIVDSEIAGNRGSVFLMSNERPPSPPPNSEKPSRKRRETMMPRPSTIVIDDSDDSASFVDAKNQFQLFGNGVPKSSNSSLGDVTNSIPQPLMDIENTSSSSLPIEGERTSSRLYRKSKYPGELLRGDDEDGAIDVMVNHWNQESGHQLKVSESKPQFEAPPVESPKEEAEADRKFSFIDDDLLQAIDRLSPSSKGHGELFTPSEEEAHVLIAAPEETKIPMTEEEIAFAQMSEDGAKSLNLPVPLMSEFLQANKDHAAKAAAGDTLPPAGPVLKRGKKFRMTGKHHIPANRLIEILNLHTSSVVNGGAFMKQTTLADRKPYRVQFSGYDLVIPDEGDQTYDSDNSQPVMYKSIANQPIYSPLESPIDTTPRQPMRLVTPASNPSDMQSRGQPLAKSVPRNTQSQQKSDETVGSREAESLTEVMENRSPPNLSVFDAPPPPPALESLDANNVTSVEAEDRPGKKKVRRRHIQIQARPVEFRTVSVQVGSSSGSHGSFDDMSKELDRELATLLQDDPSRVSELQNDKTALETELAAMRAELVDTRKRMDAISGQAYQRMKTMMKEKEEMQLEIKSLYSRLQKQ